MHQSNKYKSTLEHDSFFGWLNMFKVRNFRFVYSAGERPPYPIIVANPTLRDAISNLNMADFGLFATVSVLGFFASRRSVGTMSSTEYLRRRGFSIAWNSAIMMGSLFALMNSNNRLTGFVDNGLEWRRKDEAMRKYDFTTDWENGTIWSFFRIRD